MIMITTSRRPTRRIRSFANDLARSIPGAVRVNRGKLSRLGVAEKALELGADRVILIDRWKGVPGKVELLLVGEGGLRHHPPLIYVAGIKLQRECGARVGPAKRLSLAVMGDAGPEVARLAEALSSFLKAPLIQSIEGVSGRLMLFSSHPKHFARITFLDAPELYEVGPVISVRHLIWNP